MRAFKIHIKWTGRTSRPAGKVRALARRAAGGPVAEQPAGRDAGIAGDVFQRKAVGKTLPRFPGAYRGFGVSELGGHFFLGEVVFEAPASEDDGKIRTQTAARIHVTFLAPNAGREKLFQGPPARGRKRHRAGSPLQLPFQNLADEGGVGLALGEFHHLPFE